MQQDHQILKYADAGKVLSLHFPPLCCRYNAGLGVCVRVCERVCECPEHDQRHTDVMSLARWPTRENEEVFVVFIMFCFKLGASRNGFLACIIN